MKVRLFILTVVAVFLAAGATTVQAHLVTMGKPVNQLSLPKQAQYYQKNADHAIAFLRVWNDIRLWQIVGHQHDVGRIPEPAEVYYHRRLLRNSILGLKGVERKLEALLIPHKQGWLCLHRYEAIDWFNRDTGGNGHYGGLQMTYKWLGLIPGYAYDLSPFQQMLAAETGFRKSGYDLGWLSGQWSTYGLCASKF